MFGFVLHKWWIGGLGTRQIRQMSEAVVGDVYKCLTRTATSPPTDRDTALKWMLPNVHSRQRPKTPPFRIPPIISDTPVTGKDPAGE